MDAVEERNCREVDSFTNEIIIGMYCNEALAVEEEEVVVVAWSSFGGKAKSEMGDEKLSAKGMVSPIQHRFFEFSMDRIDCNYHTLLGARSNLRYCLGPCSVIV